MTSLPDLTRRMSRKIEAGRGMNLSGDDLDLLVASGAYAVLTQAAIRAQEDQCRKRDARNRSISGETSGSTGEKTGQTLKSSGTTNRQDVSEAEARAVEMLQPQKRPLMASISKNQKASLSAQRANDRGMRKGASS